MAFRLLPGTETSEKSLFQGGTLKLWGETLQCTIIINLAQLLKHSINDWSRESGYPIPQWSHWDFDLSPQSCTCNNSLSGIPGTTICWWSDLPKGNRVVNSFKTRTIIHWDSSGRGDMIKHSFHLRQQRWLIWDSPTRGIFEDWGCYWTIVPRKNCNVSLQGFTESLPTKVAQ